MSDGEQSKRFTFNVIILIGFASALGFAAFYALYDFEGLKAGWLGSLVCAAVIVFAPGIAVHNLRLALYSSVGVGIWAFTYMTYHMGTATGLFLFLNVFLVGSFVVNGRENLLDSFVIWLATTLAMVVSIFKNLPDKLV